MAWKWYEWVGLVVIILGFYLVGAGILSIIQSEIIVIFGAVMFLMGWNRARKTKEKKSWSKAVLQIGVFIGLLIVIFSIITFLILRNIPVV